ncbi:MAG: hypothetical protein OH335_04385 [Candidatus Parvarchaeota archaeon]|nr:hypothetical protein [Candidatus Jingweiarchaeum tengchongense]MCW1305984.1 hypothetical protein [Candidatus Jingweiarchaeum tengchongense]
MMKLRLTATQTFTYTSAQTSDNVIVTTSAPIAVISNVYNAPNYALSAIGWWTGSSGTAKLVQCTNVSGSSATFAVNDTTSTSATLLVYYLVAAGNYSWVVNVPLATGTAQATIHTGAIEDANQMDQISSDGALYFPQQIILPENYSLNLYVLAPVAISMSPAQTTTTPNMLATLSMPTDQGTMAQLLAKIPNIKQIMNSMLLGLS